MFLALIVTFLSLIRYYSPSRSFLVGEGVEEHFHLLRLQVRVFLHKREDRCGYCYKGNGRLEEALQDLGT